VLVARDAIIAMMREKGQQIPQPRYRPVIYQVRA
jgi:hypothetical protein